MNDLELNLQIIRADCKRCGVNQELTDALCKLFADGRISFMLDTEARCLRFFAVSALGGVQ
jgi:hypothetical protein